MTNKVTIVQHRLLAYREDLFQSLYQRLSAEGIELKLVHGFASKRTASRSDEATLPWSFPVKNRYFYVLGKELIFQSILRHISGTDLVILMQENRILSNYTALAYLKSMTKSSVAFWGHGRNFQSNTIDSLSERWKQMLTNQVDWWFSYTRLSTAVIEAAGFPSHKITTLDNSIDTHKFASSISAISNQELEAFNFHNKISSTAFVGLFCGSIYDHKLPQFMVDAARKLRSACPNFELIVIGGGPDANIFKQLAEANTWVHYLGAQFGPTKELAYRRADFLFNPGLLGLHILEAFASETPPLSMAKSLHSPEIAYLQHGLNGLLVTGGVDEYVNAAKKLRDSPEVLARLKRAGRETAEVYSLDRYCTNFTEGIKAAIENRKDS